MIDIAELRKGLRKIDEKFKRRKAIEVISGFDVRFDEVEKRLYRIERLLTEQLILMRQNDIQNRMVVG